MTNQEINEQVARKLGYDWKKVCMVEHKHESECPFRTPNYCTDIAAAWGIIEKLNSDKWKVDLQQTVECQGGWYCEMVDSENRHWDGAANTAPMAICLAFLNLP